MIPLKPPVLPLPRNHGLSLHRSWKAEALRQHQSSPLLQLHLDRTVGTLWPRTWAPSLHQWLWQNLHYYMFKMHLLWTTVPPLGLWMLRFLSPHNSRVHLHPKTSTPTSPRSPRSLHKRRTKSYHRPGSHSKDFSRTQLLVINQGALHPMAPSSMHSTSHSSNLN